MNRPRTSVNALLLERLLGIGWGAVPVLRAENKIGQADALEERLVAVEESSRPAPVGGARDCDLVPIPSDVWRRVKAATGYGSFECDEHVASAIEGLLKETRIAMPYANEIEDLVRALASLAEFEIDERFDPVESWRGIVAGIKEKIHGLAKDLDSSSDLADGVADELDRVKERNQALGNECLAIRDALDGQYDPFKEGETLSKVIARLIHERDALREESLKAIAAMPFGNPRHNVLVNVESLVRSHDEYRAVLDATEEREHAAKLEVARLNAELDAMAQRAVMPTFEPEPDLAFLETPLLESEPVFEPPEPGDLASKPVETEGKPDDLKPAVLYTNPPVPETFPGRDNPHPPRVSLRREEPRKPTLDDRMEAIRRLAEGESKADIASFLGLPSGRMVHGLTSMDKARIERVRQAAPHDRDGVLSAIRRELTPKEVANA